MDRLGTGSPEGPPPQAGLFIFYASFLHQQFQGFLVKVVSQHLRTTLVKINRLSLS